MKIKYNAPLTLSFALLATAVLILDSTLLPSLNLALFTVPGRLSFSFGNPLDYLRLVTHVIGHGDWNHLLGNFTLLLLLGPILEEKYGSGDLFFMMLVTALTTGLLNALFLSTGLLGASGIVFMMILLVSFTNFQKGEVPLTFILVFLLYVGQELLQMSQSDGVSQFAHILGGLIGAGFGFLTRGQKVRDAEKSQD